jgi:hypothetical protein
VPFFVFDKTASLTLRVGVVSRQGQFERETSGAKKSQTLRVPFFALLQK